MQWAKCRQAEINVAVVTITDGYFEVVGAVRKNCLVIRQIHKYADTRSIGLRRDCKRDTGQYIKDQCFTETTYTFG